MKTPDSTIKAINPQRVFNLVVAIILILAFNHILTIIFEAL